MTLNFRLITNDDVKEIIAISKHIWDGHDYIPSVINDWIANENIDPFGVILNGKLVGFGGIKYYNDIGWIAGIRVHPEHREKGIGYQLFKYGVHLAENKKKPIVQYSTYSLNKASLFIGDKLGFKIIDRRNVLHVPKENRAKFEEKVNSSTLEIPLLKLKQHKVSQYIKEHISPLLKYISKGWSFLPLKELTNFEIDDWFAYNNAIALCKKEEKKEPLDNTTRFTGQEICIICYGRDEDIEKLLMSILIQNNYTNYEDIEIFCPESFHSTAKELGFEYWDQKEAGVVLLEKRF